MKFDNLECLSSFLEQWKHGLLYLTISECSIAWEKIHFLKSCLFHFKIIALISINGFIKSNNQNTNYCFKLNIYLVSLAARE